MMRNGLLSLSFAALCFMVGVVLCLPINADEFPPLPLKPRIPDNVLPETQKYPLKRKKSMRMKMPPNMTAADLRGLTAPALSAACVHNRFNQVRKGFNYVIFNNPNGGIFKYDAASKMDGNLFDPLDKGLDEMLYLFNKDSTSECRVYSVPYYR